MKCEHCGKNEVTFMYRSSINGHVEEKHLCSECAEKLGYAGKLKMQNQRIMGSFFNESPFGRTFWQDFFTPAISLTGRSKQIENFFDDFFDDMPALSSGGTEEKQQPAKEESLLGQKEQSHFGYLRQRNALRMEMKKAVRQEDFERAAQLRDQIRTLEAEFENKESA